MNKAYFLDQCRNEDTGKTIVALPLEKTKRSFLQPPFAENGFSSLHNEFQSEEAD